MTNSTQQFFNAYLAAFSSRTVFTKNSPASMMLSPTDEDGWFEWKLINGTLVESDYKKLEKEFNIQLPKSFIEWHKEFFFLDGDCSILRLPVSNPNLPLKALRDQLDWFIAEQLIPQKLYPFADEGNDTGPLVFDGRIAMKDNEFPIRVYDHEYGGDPEGLSEIIFSSFGKLLECLTFFMTEVKTKTNPGIVAEFFKIDPSGAGSKGANYWQQWAGM
jgi:hypothetical protein